MVPLFTTWSWGLGGGREVPPSRSWLEKWRRWGLEGLQETVSEIGPWVYVSCGISFCLGFNSSLVLIKAGPLYNKNLSSFCHLLQSTHVEQGAGPQQSLLYARHSLPCSEGWGSPSVFTQGSLGGSCRGGWRWKRAGAFSWHAWSMLRCSLLILTVAAWGRNWCFHFADQKTEAPQSALIFPKAVNGRTGANPWMQLHRACFVPCQIPGGIPGPGTNLIHYVWAKGELSSFWEGGTYHTPKVATPGHLEGHGLAGPFTESDLIKWDLWVIPHTGTGTLTQANSAWAALNMWLFPKVALLSVEIREWRPPSNLNWNGNKMGVGCRNKSSPNESLIEMY